MGIGTRLVELMNDKNINANELANKIGVAPTTLYSMIKRDSSRVDIDLIIKISHALNMTADEFLSGEKTVRTTSLSAHLKSNDFTEEEIREITNFADYVKQKRS